MVSHHSSGRADNFRYGRRRVSQYLLSGEAEQSVLRSSLRPRSADRGNGSWVVKSHVRVIPSADYLRSIGE
jgi:hypothetical protein